MLLYLIFGPLLLYVICSRVDGARKLVLTGLIFIGGYGYIMLREATKYQGERKRKREFLDRVAPKNGQRRQQSNNGTGGGGSGYRGGYGGSGGKQASYTPSPSPQSRATSNGAKW